MTENERHTMVMVKRRGEWIEEWFCRACGRRLEMTWPDSPWGFHREILQPGDETVIHTGGKSFAEFSDLLHLETGEVTIDRHDPRLDVFDEWLKGRKK